MDGVASVVEPKVHLASIPLASVLGSLKVVSVLGSISVLYYFDSAAGG